LLNFLKWNGLDYAENSEGDDDFGAVGETGEVKLVEEASKKMHSNLTSLLKLICQD